MNLLQIKEKINSSDYKFLNEHPYLKDKIILLTLGGSYAYGTNNKNSDLDIRGICKTPIDTLLGLNNFEQFIEPITDTTVYSFNKIVKLLIDCNPNTIEMLGCKPEHYLILTPIGKELKDNINMFLSQRCIYSFGGYAVDQLRRLQNVLARDEYSQEDKEKHICNHLNSQMYHLQKQYKHFTNNEIKVYVDNTEREGFDKEIYMDINLQHYPLRDFKDIYDRMHEVIKTYTKLGKRNKKKTEEGLNKHAMHLIRLYLMLMDILEGRGVNTYREKDREFLLDIRNGKYEYSDIFEMVNIYEKKVEYAKINTNLPNDINWNDVQEFIIDINRRSL
jgi:predicted nucleotidyltransferase